MAFVANPLALSVPEATFESWLRDSGYLEVLDQRTSDLHRLSSSFSDTTTTQSTSNDSAAAETLPATAVTTGIFLWLFSYLRTLISLFTGNPFSKLTSDDFTGETPSWTHKLERQEMIVLNLLGPKANQHKTLEQELGIPVKTVRKKVRSRAIESKKCQNK